MLSRLIFCLIFLALASPATAASWVRVIHVEWGYTPPIEPAVEGFVLYRASQEVCRWEGADVRAGDCELVISAPSTDFTLTAVFTDGTESPQSAPFTFNDTVSAPSITIISR